MRKGRITDDFDAQGLTESELYHALVSAPLHPHSHDGVHHASAFHDGAGRGRSRRLRGIGLLAQLARATARGLHARADRAGVPGRRRHQDTAQGLLAAPPATVPVLAGAAVLTWWLLNRTLIGRAVHAILR